MCRHFEGSVRNSRKTPYKIHWGIHTTFQILRGHPFHPLSPQYGDGRILFVRYIPCSVPTSILGNFDRPHKAFLASRSRIKCCLCTVA